MATSKKSSKKSTEDEENDVVIGSPAKLLLHEKDGGHFPRDVIGMRPLPVNGGVKIISWNVAGLRGTLKKFPEVLNDLVDNQRPDILCIQEHKLQTIGEYGDLLVNKGYTSYWTYSEIKKGYSGTAVFIKQIIDPLNIKSFANGKEGAVEVEGGSKKKAKKQTTMAAFFGGGGDKASDKTEVETAATESEGKVVLNKENIGTVVVEDVVFQFPVEESQNAFYLDYKKEGRWVQIETPDFYFINSYVPNAGQVLERLDLRVEGWDVHVREHLNNLKLKKPVIFSGDLNVAHKDIDVYNCKAKHLFKQSGCTPRERESFSKLLSTGFHDALRYLYPDASGQFTYWSQRTKARPYNKGLRLDYFVCSEDMFPTAGSSSSSSSSSASTSVIVETEIKNTKKRSAAAIAKEEKEGKEKEYKEKGHKVEVVDCYILHDENDCSDHCPVVLMLKV